MDTFADRSALASAPTSIGAAYLREVGREGIFAWQAGDQSSNVARDPGRGIYIAPPGQTGSQGAWVRQYDGLAKATWFGLVVPGDAAANSSAVELAMRAARKVELPAGDINWRGVPMRVQGAELVGQGMAATRLIAVNDAHIYPDTGSGYRLRDLTFHTTGTGALAGQVGSFHQDVSDFRMERVRFTNTGALTTNCFSIVADNSPVGWWDVYLLDCEFHGARMCVELQAHGQSTAMKFGRVHLHRCRFYEPGSNPAFGLDASMCLSISGHSEDIYVEDCLFNDARYAALELIHTRSATVRNNRFGNMPQASVISVTNATTQYGHVIVGNRMTPDSRGSFCRLDSMVNCVFSNNVLFLNNSVQFRGANNVIADNIIDSVTNNGLVVDNGVGNKISGNKLSAEAGPPLAYINSAAANIATDNVLICRTTSVDPSSAAAFVRDYNPSGGNLSIRNVQYVPGKAPVSAA
jgi:hypothetical protein